MNGIPWDADSAASLLYSSLQQQQPECAKKPDGDSSSQLAHGRKPKHTLSNELSAQQHALGASDMMTHSSGGSNVSSSANNRRSRGRNDNQQAAEAVGRRPKLRQTAQHALCKTQRLAVATRFGLLLGPLHATINPGKH